MQTSSDFEDLLSSLNEAGAKYLIVGGIALAFHDRPRFTRDLDVWIDRSKENAARAFAALSSFGAPLEKVTPEDLEKPDLIFQIGVAPVRVDILTSVSGVSFEDAWLHRVEGKYGAAPIWVIGLEDLIRNKRATGRPQDLVDIKELETSR